jgi:hypothetical protein
LLDYFSLDTCHSETQTPNLVVSNTVFAEILALHKVVLPIKSDLGGWGWGQRDKSF